MPKEKVCNYFAPYKKIMKNSELSSEMHHNDCRFYCNFIIIISPYFP